MSTAWHNWPKSLHLPRYSCHHLAVIVVQLVLFSFLCLPQRVATSSMWIRPSCPYFPQRRTSSCRQASPEPQTPWLTDPAFTTHVGQGPEPGNPGPTGFLTTGAHGPGTHHTGWPEDLELETGTPPNAPPLGLTNPTPTARASPRTWARWLTPTTLMGQRTRGRQSDPVRLPAPRAITYIPKMQINFQLVM